MPYSFGQKRWLSDLFSRAGFVNVETAEKIRHIKPGEELATINALINELEPELLFIFERKENAQCAFIKPKTPLAIINLDGEKFLHPAPAVLDGLTELQRHRSQWRD
jgi:iron complex transport system substrate-binding protein